ncbi:VCBS domain-containing protein, partial [Phenylobacterium sp. LjRoot225]|uniref:VCBS domain-containing protein n=1 Tax=Phenylobacterium sp. LjRoot225 TaxID=3342285 RepID=UPI003F50D380
MAISGTSGLSGGDTITGAAGAETLNGGAGADSIFAGAGSDKISAGSGNDTIDGGSGSDTVNGDAGNDVLIYSSGQLPGTLDVYDGGSGQDVLRLNLTLSTWYSSAFQTDLARYQTFLGAHINPVNGQADNATFQFTAFNLQVSKIEAVNVVVDGQALSAADNAVLLAGDTMTAAEDGAGATGNLLANDSVLDQVKTFSATHGAHGTVATVFDNSVVNAASASATYTAGSYWNYLAAGQHGTDSFTYTVTDADGQTSTTTVTVDVVGVNDAVEITSAAQAGEVVEDGTPSAAGTIAFTDVDLSDGHTAGFAASPANATSLGTFSLDPVSEAADAASGSVGWRYALDPAAAQRLAEGQSVTETYVVTVDDGHGGAAQQTVTVTITGTNDGPAAVADTASGTENQA